jgi:DNA-binding IclR family transcriptional regulator
MRQTSGPCIAPLPGVGGPFGPLFNAGGIVGSLSVSGPSSRWNDSAMESAAPLLTRVSTELSAALGHRVD